MLQQRSRRLVTLAGLAVLLLAGRSLQAAPSTVVATMTIASAIAHDPPTNALIVVHAQDSVDIAVTSPGVHVAELEKPSPGKRVYNLRHLPPQQIRLADVYATYTYPNMQKVTLFENVKVQAGVVSEVHFTQARFNRNRPLPRIKDPIALYKFREGGGRMIHDDAKKLPAPLDLYIHDESKTKWSKHGLHVTGKVLIASVRPAKELVQALDTTDAMTIEAWIKPDNATQHGPARIVSLSDGTSRRDFTLGQEGNKYDVRLRATQVGADKQEQDNGRPSVATQANSVSANKIAHVVYTRLKNGEAKIYVNGKVLGRGHRPGGFSIWKDDFHFLLGNEINSNLDRTWLGTYYLVAIYDRALTQAEVDQNRRAGL